MRRTARRRILVDCMTLWLSNLCYRHRALRHEAREARILGAVSAFIEAARECQGDIIVVSNEVGGGVVPESAVARDFRDLQGLANQAVAGEADRVVLMVAGFHHAIRRRSPVRHLGGNCSLGGPCPDFRHPGLNDFLRQIHRVTGRPVHDRLLTCPRQ